MTAVFIQIRKWERRGHGGLSQEVDYEVFVNRMSLRMFSTHGSMDEGYWGSAAKKNAEAYAEKLALTLGVKVYMVKRRSKR